MCTAGQRVSLTITGSKLCFFLTLILFLPVCFVFSVRNECCSNIIELYSIPQRHNLSTTQFVQRPEQRLTKITIRSAYGLITGMMRCEKEEEEDVKEEEGVKEEEDVKEEKEEDDDDRGGRKGSIYRAYKYGRLGT